MQHVIIGNGVAGITAANELRRLDAEAAITIISCESEHFFSRPALMYEFCGQLSRSDIEPYERTHYERMGFNRVTGRVHSIDTEQKILRLDSQEISFDTLLLAVGSRPVQAPWQPAGVQGVGHFVTLQDLEWLKTATRKAAAKRVAVVGGGLIGIEIAEILLAAGFAVQFIIREDWYWPVALNREEAQFIATHMADHGCSILLETEVSEVSTDGATVTGVALQTGETVPVDLLLVAIGVTPNTSFLEDSPIHLDYEARHRGILVNEFLETSVPGIFAAGDCATVSWFDGQRRPEQLWYTARDQGYIAAANMFGLRKKYERGVLYNAAKFFDIEYTTVGLVNFQLEGQSEWYQKIPNQPISQRIVMQHDRVVGFNMIGTRWDHRYFICWIQEGRDLTYVLKNLHKAQFDAEFTPPFKVLPAAITSVSTA